MHVLMNSVAALFRFRFSTVACAALVSCVGQLPAFAAAPTAHKQGIAWQVVSSPSDVDKAFQLAVKSGKPVFLYWGAVWCPPCNQVKATLFNRADFIERSRAFIPVYVDGDKAGAQKVAARFKVSGYPTMVLFRSDGTEITRLPGEIDPQRYLLTLTSALNADVSVKELVQRALSKQALTPQQWRMLSYYSWETDQDQLVSSRDLAARLTELASLVPSNLPLVRDRLAFKAAAARADGDSKSDAEMLRTDREVVDRVLGAESASPELSDLVIYFGEPMVKHLTAEGSDQRRQLAVRWDRAIESTLRAGDLSATARVDALDSQVALWKFEAGDAISESRRSQILARVSEIVGSTTDRYERQSVVPSAAHVLTSAGLIDESDRLLKTELPRAVAPYYHMLGLAGNAKKRGDAKSALQWYESAYRKSEGSATRLQWGSNYVINVVDLAPSDAARVLAAASSVISGLEPKNETFFERNERSLQRMAKRLVGWQGNDPIRVNVVRKVRNQVAGICSKLPQKSEGRSNCDAVFSEQSSKT